DDRTLARPHPLHRRVRAEPTSRTGGRPLDRLGEHSERSRVLPRGRGVGRLTHLPPTGGGGGNGAFPIGGCRQWSLTRDFTLFSRPSKAFLGRNGLLDGDLSDGLRGGVQPTHHAPPRRSRRRRVCSSVRGGAAATRRCTASVVAALMRHHRG